MMEHPLETSQHRPAYHDFLRVFARIGLLSFGGPAAQIAMMHRILVEEKKWIDERQYMNALGFCMMLPGPEAMQLATYSGWRLYGIRGGLAAGLLFIIPGALIVLALSLIYARWGKTPLIEAMFLGIQATVLVVVIEALLRIAKRALGTVRHSILALASFAGIFVFALPYPFIIALAAAYGWFCTNASGQTAASARAPSINTRIQTKPSQSGLTNALIIITVGLGFWFTPLVLLDALAAPSILVEIGVFFSKLAILTFGGAYAVLTYMAQDVVQHYGWLEPGEMIDGLGLAETTPGPLILVTQFVGFLAAVREGGLSVGLAGALVTLWVTFVPCFIWIFAGAGWIEWITAQPRLKSAMACIIAAVTGAMINLSLWFGLHVLFEKLACHQYGFMTVCWPDLTVVNWQALMLFFCAGFALFRLRLDVIYVLAGAAGFGWILSELAPL